MIDTNFMNKIIFFIIVFVLFIFITPIKLKAKIKFNVLLNKGQIKFYFFKINFLSFNFKIKRKYILLTTKKGKNIVVPLEFGQEANLEYVDLTYLLLDKTTINTLKININAGVEDNPFQTAIMYGFLQTITSIFLCLLKTKKLSVIVSNKINPVYTKDRGIINISSSLTVSLVDYLWAFMQYLIKFKRVGKNYEK